MGGSSYVRSPFREVNESSACRASIFKNIFREDPLADAAAQGAFGSFMAWLQSRYRIANLLPSSEQESMRRRARLSLRLLDVISVDLVLQESSTFLDSALSAADTLLTDYPDVWQTPVCLDCPFHYCHSGAVDTVGQEEKQVTLGEEVRSIEGVLSDVREKIRRVRDMIESLRISARADGRVDDRLLPEVRDEIVEMRKCVEHVRRHHHLCEGAPLRHGIFEFQTRIR